MRAHHLVQGGATQHWRGLALHENASAAVAGASGTGGLRGGGEETYKDTYISWTFQQTQQSHRQRSARGLSSLGGWQARVRVCFHQYQKGPSRCCARRPDAPEQKIGRLPTSANCEVDDVEWVRCFSRHGVPRPAKACLISPRPPQPQGLPRNPQWRGRPGPDGSS